MKKINEQCFCPGCHLNLLLWKLQFWIAAFEQYSVKPSVCRIYQFYFPFQLLWSHVPFLHARRWASEHFYRWNGSQQASIRVHAQIHLLWRSEHASWRLPVSLNSKELKGLSQCMSSRSPSFCFGLPSTDWEDGLSGGHQQALHLHSSQGFVCHQRSHLRFLVYSSMDE